MPLDLFGGPGARCPPPPKQGAIRLYIEPFNAIKGAFRPFASLIFMPFSMDIPSMFMRAHAWLGSADCPY